MIRSSRIATASLVALLASSFAVGQLAAVAAAADYYLKLGDIKGESTDKGHKGEIDVLSWSWGETNRAASKYDSFTWKQGTARGSAGGDDDGDGSADVAKALDKSTPKLAEARERAEADAAKRHGKATPKLTEALAAAQGSLTIAGRLPGCAVGRQYDDALLGGPGVRYELKDVAIISCADASVSFNYSSIRELPKQTQAR